VVPDGNQICAVGLEYRDYATLVAAVAELPDIRLKIDCASPWSTHANRLSTDNLPPNVEICRNAFGKLKEFYAQSAIVAIPLLPNDISAGLTSLLEAMAMGKAVVITQTVGHKDLVHGDTVLLVPPSDVAAWREAIESLMHNPALRERLGRNAREWVARHASREAWLNEIVGILRPISLPLGFEARPLLQLGQTPHGNQ
jgi:glycosyltransferase involved in cell wall biosynthesis